MKSQIKKVLLGVAVATVVAGCGSYGSAHKREQAASFATAVDGSDAFLGVVVDEADDRVMAYVCDGKSVAAWFNGKAAEDGTISLTSADGTRLTGRVADGRLTGSLILPGGGSSHSFNSAEVDPPAGLYRSKTQLRGESAVGGWVVLEDGRQRGAVRTTSGFTSTDTDLAKPNKPVTGFTTTDVDF